MKIIKKAPKFKSVCGTCKTEYTISAKDFKQVRYLGNRLWLKCKMCKRLDVEVCDENN